MKCSRLGRVSPYVCARPFQMLEVHERGVTFLCCPSWLKPSIGNLAESTVDDVWNGSVARDIRRSVLDGSFSHCDETVCPHLKNGTGPVGSLEDLAERGFSDKIITSIRDGSTELAHGPLPSTAVTTVLATSPALLAEVASSYAPVPSAIGSLGSRPPSAGKR